MKNYLLLMKEKLFANKGAFIPKDENSNHSVIVGENTKVIDIANVLGLEFFIHSLRKLPSNDGWNGANRYNVNDNNMVFFYPLNDGMPTCPFEFYKNGKLIISNQENYSSIINLDEIILEIVRIFNRSLDNGIVLDPYYFMLKLDDELKENYSGKASLVITEKAIRNQKLNEENFDEATKYFINHFLDHFIGWNFGVSVNRNEILRNELEALNDKVINLGIREYAGPGFEVYGVDYEEDCGLQHYYLPVKKEELSRKLSQN